MITKYEQTDNFGQLQCPSCGSSSLKNHAVYERNYIYFEKEAKIETTIKIKQLKCESCNKTHAIIPSPIVPYKQHVLLLIIDVLEQMATHSKRRVAKENNITRSLLYFWEYIYIKHKPKLETIKLKLKDFKINFYQCDIEYIKTYDTRLLEYY